MDTSCRLPSRCRDLKTRGSFGHWWRSRFSIPLSLLGSSEDRGGLPRKRFSDIGNGSQGWALRAPLQLANVAFGVAKFICQFLLAPATCDAQSSDLGTDSLTQGARLALFIGTDLFGHASMVAV
jgi:hypothetical protein